MPDMRFAPPAALRVGNTEGLNPSRVKTHNDRLVLSLLRQHDALSRMEIGQITGLSPQTVSVIVRALEKDGLCLAGETRKGKVGPPSTPMSLNPDGAFSLGFTVGQKGALGVLIDFLGMTRAQVGISYPKPKIEVVQDWISAAAATMLSDLPEAMRERTVGLGFAFPKHLDLCSGPDERPISVDAVEKQLSADTGLEVFVQNDVTAAASAEVIFGDPSEHHDFIYLFIGRSTEMRLVLNHRVYSGEVSPNLQPMEGLVLFESMLKDSGIEPDFVWSASSEWSDGPVRQQWMDRVVPQICGLLSIVCGVVGVRNIKIAGDLPDEVIAEIVLGTRAGLTGTEAGDTEWLVQAGKIGRAAKAVGAASAPLYSRFMNEDVGISGFIDR